MATISILETVRDIAVQMNSRTPVQNTPSAARTQKSTKPSGGVGVLDRVAIKPSDINGNLIVALRESLGEGTIHPGLIGRFVKGQKLSSKDLAVLGVARHLSEWKADAEDREGGIDAMVNLVNGKLHTVLEAAASGSWKSGRPFRLTPDSAVEIVKAIDIAESARTKSALSSFESAGGNVFVAEFGEFCPDWAVELYTAASTGNWPKSGKKFFWNQKNAQRVNSSIELLERILVRTYKNATR